MYGIVEWHVKFICALRIALNCIKLLQFLKVIMFAKSRLEVEGSWESLPKSVYVCVVQREVFDR